MNLRHLKIFLYVCKNNSITIASHELGIEQPAVSFAIKELEKSLNTSLFHRVTRGLEITEQGTILLGHTMKLFELYNEMELTMHSKSEQSNISIGASITLGKHFLPIYISKFNKIYPNVPINLLVDTNANIKRMIHEKKIAIAYLDTNFEDDDLEVIKYHKDKIVAVCPKEHHLSKKSKITLHDLSQEGLLLRTKGNGDREAIDVAFKNLALPYHVVLENDLGVLLLNAVSNNLGVAIVPQAIALDYGNQNQTKIIPIENVNLDRYFCVVHLKETNLPDLFNHFIQISIDKDNWMLLSRQIG